MSDIAGDVARISEALAGPRLKLINHKWAPLVLGVFAAAYGPNVNAVRAERLQALVDQYVDELDALGVEVPPNAQGRTLCNEWMVAGWLKRIPDADGGEAYELTSDALAAQRVMEGMARDQTTLGESRLTTIIATVHRAARDANPDREARIASLDEEISRLTAERDRLADGGVLVQASDDQMLSSYADVLDLMAQLPGDFRRVEEKIDSIHASTLQAFRAGAAGRGAVVGWYLAESTRLMAETEEGRAFEGALSVLSDEELLDQVRTDLRAIIAHPFAEALTLKERAAFKDLVKALKSGRDGVINRKQRSSSSMAEQLKRQDTAEVRQVNNLLRTVSEELGVWMQTARPRDLVPMQWMPQRAEMPYLKTSFYDPSTERPVTPLRDVTEQAPEPPSLAEVRRFGGPLLAEVRAGVLDALADGSATLGEAFNHLDGDLRRPVEVFGLLQVATEVGLLPDGSKDEEAVETLRPDGTRRVLLFPRLAVTPDQISSTQEEML